MNDPFPDDHERLLTAAEAAAFLGIGLTKFNELRRDKAFPVVKFMSDNRFRVSDLEAFADRHVTWGWRASGATS